jgi:hypothetical protein
METSAIFIKILQILAGRYNMSFSLEEITNLVTSVSNVSKFTGDMNAQKENQSKLLNVLISMDYEGYIFLNPYTDESAITIKGLIKINNKIFWN